MIEELLIAASLASLAVSCALLVGGKPQEAIWMILVAINLKLPFWRPRE